jgi:hypothetical protein
MNQRNSIEEGPYLLGIDGMSLLPSACLSVGEWIIKEKFLQNYKKSLSIMMLLKGRRANTWNFFSSFFFLPHLYNLEHL